MIFVHTQIHITKHIKSNRNWNMPFINLLLHVPFTEFEGALSAKFSHMCYCCSLQSVVPINMLAISYRWFVRGGDLRRPSQAAPRATSAPTAPSPLTKKHSCLITASLTTGRTPYPVPIASTDQQTPARWRGTCGYILVRSRICAHTAHMKQQMAAIWNGTSAHIQERSLTPAHIVPIKLQWKGI